MKTLFYSLPTCVLAFLLCITQTNAQQQFTNGDMENWKSKTNGSKTYEEPDGWFTQNLMVRYIGFSESSVKVTQANSGTYAIMLETKGGGISGPYSGFLTSNLIMDTTFPGLPEPERNFVPFTDRPDVMEFFYMASPASGDTNLVACYLTKWNATAGMRDTIGMAIWENNATVSSYTNAAAKFTYTSSANPDSMSFVAASSKSFVLPHTTGSILYLDDLKLNYMVSNIEDNKRNANVQLYPNPAREEVRISCSNAIRSVELYDLQGKLLLAPASLSGTFAKLDTKQFPHGAYLVKVNLQNGGYETTRLMLVP